MRYHVKYILGAALAASLSLSVNGAAQTPPAAVFSIAAQAGSLVSDARYDTFTPRPNGQKRSLDYSVFDEALSQVIVDLGPSTRIWERRPAAAVGSRIVTGHKSPFRLEGKRFTFSYINDEYKDGLSSYRKDLERTATKYDITAFPKAEQLAFWLNLHNVAMIEQIAKNYPVKHPRDIRINIDGSTAQLDDAKFLNVKGQALSLRDIREKIVFANWDDPRVIYGFFRGDIGGPSITEYAFKADSMDYLLDSNAREFVNSLRGYRRVYGKAKVSEIYDKDGRFFFKNWDQDLKAHLLKYANKKVTKELSPITTFSVAHYEDDIADMAGGGGFRAGNLARSACGVNSNGVGNLIAGPAGCSIIDGGFDGSKNTPPEVARLLNETRDKYQILIDRGVIRRRGGRVIIVDLNEDGS